MNIGLQRKSLIFSLALFFVVIATHLIAQNQYPTADEIIDNYIKASGGSKQLKSIHSMRLKGKYTFRGFEYSLTIYRMRPYYYRIEIIIDGKKQISAFDGETVWELNESRSMEPSKVQDPRTKFFIESNADFDGAIVDYSAKGYQVEFLGKEEVDGKSAYKIKLIHKNGKNEDWFIDSSTFSLVKRYSTLTYNNRKFAQTLYYMDYKTVNKFEIPHYIERLDAHYVRGYEILDVEINPEIEPDLFRLPNVFVKEK